MYTYLTLLRLKFINLCINVPVPFSITKTLISLCAQNNRCLLPNHNTHKYGVRNNWSLTVTKYGGAYSKFKGSICIELLEQKPVRRRRRLLAPFACNFYSSSAYSST